MQQHLALNNIVERNPPEASSPAYRLSGLWATLLAIQPSAETWCWRAVLWCPF